jgi:hypothetical protein
MKEEMLKLHDQVSDLPTDQQHQAEPRIYKARCTKRCT